MTGALFFWIIAICCFGLKGLKTKIRKIFGFVLFLIIGIIFGFIAKAIPNVFNPWVSWPSGAFFIVFHNCACYKFCG